MVIYNIHTKFELNRMPPSYIYHFQYSTVIIKRTVINLNLKKKDTPINSITNYRSEVKLIPINMDYCLLQFDDLKFFSGVRLHKGSPPNFNFFNINPQI